MLKFSAISGLKDTANLLLGCPFLAPLSARERSALLSYCHKRDYRAGEAIYDVGDPATSMYFVVSGKVRIQAFTPDAQLVSVTLGAADVFGVLGLTLESARQASAKAETETRLLGFFQSDFETLKSRNPRLALSVFQLLHKIAAFRLDEMLKSPPVPSEKVHPEMRLELLPDRFDLLAGR